MHAFISIPRTDHNLKSVKAGFSLHHWIPCISCLARLHGISGDVQRAITKPGEHSQVLKQCSGYGSGNRTWRYRTTQQGIQESTLGTNGVNTTVFSDITSLHFEQDCIFIKKVKAKARNFGEVTIPTSLPKGKRGPGTLEFNKIVVVFSQDVIKYTQLFQFCQRNLGA